MTTPENAEAEPTSCDYYSQNGCTQDADHDGPHTPEKAEPAAPKADSAPPEASS